MMSRNLLYLLYKPYLSGIRLIKCEINLRLPWQSSLCTRDISSRLENTLIEAFRVDMWSFIHHFALSSISQTLHNSRDSMSDLHFNSFLWMHGFFSQFLSLIFTCTDKRTRLFIKGLSVYLLLCINFIITGFHPDGNN